MCTANISQAVRRKQRQPLRKPAVRTLKNSTEERKGDGERQRGGKIYLRISAGSNKAAMEKYWYFMHGNTTMHLKNIDVKKTRLSERYKCCMKQVELWKGERVLLWDKWAVFFNIDQSSVKWIWMEFGVNDRMSQKDIYIWVHITCLPLLQCLMAILHILDSAMVGQGIVSLGGFFTMCRVRVSRPHL